MGNSKGPNLANATFPPGKQPAFLGDDGGKNIIIPLSSRSFPVAGGWALGENTSDEFIHPRNNRYKSPENQRLAPENGGCLLSEIRIPSPEWQMRTFCWVKKGSYGFIWKTIWMIMEDQRSISRHIEGEWYLTNDKLKKKHP